MSTWLMHHGVKGQKWGVKHGPPYPLTGKNAERARKAFDKRINSEWWKSFNKAGDKFNVWINEYNDNFEKKYGENGYKEHEYEYIKGIDDYWRPLYKETLLDDLGTDWVTNGEEWVENVPYYWQYSQILDEIKEHGSSGLFD